MRYTKNKYLRRLVRDYEIELRRPKGVKLIDLTLKSVPKEMKDLVIFCGSTVHKEAEHISRYKGIEVVGTNGLNKEIVITSKSNMFFK